jgi:hypothetical protein
MDQENEAGPKAGGESERCVGNRNVQRTFGQFQKYCDENFIVYDKKFNKPLDKASAEYYDKVFLSKL